MLLLQIKRERAGWSRAELARRAGLHASTVGAIEARRLNPYPSQLKKLAKALGIPQERAHRLTREAGDGRS